MVWISRCTTFTRELSQIRISKNWTKQISMPQCTNIWNPRLIMEFLTIISQAKLMLMSHQKTIKSFLKGLPKKVSYFWRMKNLHCLWGNHLWEQTISLSSETPHTTDSLISTARVWLRMTKLLSLSICFVRGWDFQNWATKLCQRKWKFATKLTTTASSLVEN